MKVFDYPNRVDLRYKTLCDTKFSREAEDTQAGNEF